MSLIHDIIKIKYIESGYLPDYPYHLISDAEMCYAFLHRYDKDKDVDVEGYSVFDPQTQQQLYNDDIKIAGFFPDTYNLDDMKECKQYSDMQKYYVELVRAMLHYIDDLKSSFNTEYELPTWMYQYMLESVIHSDSPDKDRHDSLILFDEDNRDDAFTSKFYDKVLISSKSWIQKLNRSYVGVSSELAEGISDYPDVVERDSKISLLLPVPSSFVTPHVIKDAQLLNLDPDSDTMKNIRYKYLDDE